MELNFRTFFKALSNENRIKILMLMYQKKRITPTDIVNRFYLEQPTVARHLTMLEKCGIITRKRVKTNAPKTGNSRSVYCELNLEFIQRGFMEFLLYLMSQREEGDGDIKRKFLENSVKVNRNIKPKAIGFIDACNEITIMKLEQYKEPTCHLS